MTSLPCITLNRYAQERAKKRHPWIFSNELGDPKRFQRLEPGSLVDVLDCHGDYLGTGFVNPRSLIAVRILSRQRGEELGEGFFHQKIKAALGLREALYGKNTGAGGTYRAVFGEADGLPGLVIDRFQGAWVLEPHALGMALRLGEIAEALAEFSGIDAVVARTDNRAAQLEGIEDVSGLLRGSIPAEGVFAVEDGIRFPVDPLKGQKTGFFFDQRDNRTFFRDWVKGKGAVRVLDVFCHAGAWGLRALQAGAAHATFVDRSVSALESVMEAARKLGVQDRVKCVEGDAMEVMKTLEAGSFAAVALDPPALIPSKKSLPAGSKNYRDLNAKAIRLVSPGGLLSTSSCSYHLQEERFEEIVARALAEQGRTGRVLRRGGLSADHPFLAGMEEGRYLKNLAIALE